MDLIFPASDSFCRKGIKQPSGLKEQNTHLQSSERFLGSTEEISSEIVRAERARCAHHHGIEAQNRAATGRSGHCVLGVLRKRPRLGKKHYVGALFGKQLRAKHVLNYQLRSDLQIGFKLHSIPEPFNIPRYSLRLSKVFSIVFEQCCESYTTGSH
jgi:hypothetical protein